MLILFSVSCEVDDERSVGQSKAKSVCAFLQELNDSVKATFIEENPDTLISTNPFFFSQFTLVIATQVHDWVSTCQCHFLVFTRQSFNLYLFPFGGTS